jgi:hypothetical protein
LSVRDAASGVRSGPLALRSLVLAFGNPLADSMREEANGRRQNDYGGREHQHVGAKS